MLVRADLHLTHRAGARGACCLAGTGDALRQHDRATQIATGEVGFVAVADIDQTSGHAIRRRAAREGMRDAGQRMVVHIDARLARQADIGVVHDQLRAVAVLVEPRLEVAQALQLVRSAGQLHPARQLLHMSHQDRAIDRLAQRTTNRIAHGLSPSCGYADAASVRALADASRRALTPAARAASVTVNISSTSISSSVTGVSAVSM